MQEQHKLTNALTSLGAGKNEIALYFASYRYGKTTIGRLANALGMDRSSAYLAIKQLKKRGLVEEEFKGKQKVVWVRSPKDVLARLRVEMRKLRDRYDTLSESLPQLLAEYQEQETKPVLRVFSGPEGLEQIEEDVLEHARGEILLLTNQREERKVFSESDHRYFIRERMKKGIRIRVLAVDTPEARELQKSDAKSLRETRIIPLSEPIPFTTETYLYADKIAFLGFKKEIIGFIVHSREFAETQSWMFERIWSMVPQ